MNYHAILFVYLYYTQLLVRLSKSSALLSHGRLTPRRGLVRRSPDLYREEYSTLPTDTSNSTAPVDHIIFIVHGVGTENSRLASSAMKFRQTLDTVKGHSFKDTPCETHVEVINWKKTVKKEQLSLLQRLKPSASADVDEMRDTINNAATDLMYFLTPSRKESLVSDVTNQLNTAYETLLETDPTRFRNAKVAIVGYSMGAMIVYDILSSPESLVFPVHSFFSWGSPLAAYLSIENSNELQLPRALRHYFNIYHPLDPFGFRQEPLIVGYQSKPAEQLRKWFTLPFSGEDKSNTQGGVQRIDYVLPTSLYDTVGITELLMLQSHSSYWTSTDVAFHILLTLTGVDGDVFFDNEWTE